MSSDYSTARPSLVSQILSYLLLPITILINLIKRISGDESASALPISTGIFKFPEPKAKLGGWRYTPAIDAAKAESIANKQRLKMQEERELAEILGVWANGTGAESRAAPGVTQRRAKGQ